MSCTAPAGRSSSSDVRMDNPLCEAFVDAASRPGIPLTDDFNGTSQEGVGYYQ